MLKVFRFLKHNLIAVIGAVTLVSITDYASGLWSNFPILNGASYCSSFITVGTSPTPGGTNAAAGCVSTIPAGPALTGNETVPADTNLTQGQVATVKVPFPVLGVGTYVIATPVTGGNQTLVNTNRQLLITGDSAGSGTIASFAIGFPAASTLLDGQRMGVCTNIIVTSLGMTAGTGTIIQGKPTALLVPVTTGGASCVEWLYDAPAALWIRVQ